MYNVQVQVQADGTAIINSDPTGRLRVPANEIREFLVAGADAVLFGQCPPEFYREVVSALKLAGYEVSEFENL